VDTTATVFPVEKVAVAVVVNVFELIEDPG
jgi:hypothetical protein